LYDPVSGRFSVKDPIGFADGSNLYSIYIGLELLDPSGNISVRELAGLVGDALGAIGFSAGSTVFGQAPLIPWIPGSPYPGIYQRIQSDSRVGTCDCKCSDTGAYVQKVFTYELGIYYGAMAPSWHVAMPIMEHKKECPQTLAPRITGGFTLRAVLYPLVGTCRFEYPSFRPNCNMSIRLTRLTAGIVNISLSGHVTFGLQASRGCADRG
jgi:hypothetical protein